MVVLDVLDKAADVKLLEVEFNDYYGTAIKVQGRPAALSSAIEAARRVGVHPMVYMHFTILDEGSTLFEKLKDSIQINAAGKPAVYGWKGPDVIKQTWRMSTASPAWRENLLKQAQ